MIVSSFYSTKNQQLAMEAFRSILDRIAPASVQAETVLTLCNLASTRRSESDLIEILKSSQKVSTAKNFCELIIKQDIDFDRLLFGMDVDHTVSTYQSSVLTLILWLMPFSAALNRAMQQFVMRETPEVSRQFATSIQPILLTGLSTPHRELRLHLWAIAVSLESNVFEMTDVIFATLRYASAVNDIRQAVVVILSYYPGFHLIGESQILEFLAVERSVEWYAEKYAQISKAAPSPFHEELPSMTLKEIVAALRASKISPFQLLSPKAIEKCTALLRTEGLRLPRKRIEHFGAFARQALSWFPIKNTQSKSTVSSFITFLSRSITVNIQSDDFDSSTNRGLRWPLCFEPSLLRLPSLDNVTDIFRRVLADHLLATYLASDRSDFRNADAALLLYCLRRQELGGRHLECNDLHFMPHQDWFTVLRRMGTPAASSLHVNLVESGSSSDDEWATGGGSFPFLDLLELVSKLSNVSLVNQEFVQRLVNDLVHPFETMTMQSESLKIILRYPFLFPVEVRVLVMKIARFDVISGLNALLHHLNISDSPVQLFDGYCRPVRLSVSRSRLFEDGIVILKNFCSHFVPIRVVFENEMGTRIGPTKEFFTELSRQFCHQSRRMFRTTSTSHEFVQNPQGMFPEKFRLLGILCAKAISMDLVLDIPFNPAFFCTCQWRDL